MAIATTAGFLACAEQVVSPEPLRVVWLRSVEGVPPSQSSDLLLLESGFACTTDQYLLKVRCLDPGQEEWRVLGREGEGPGELRSVSWLVAVADNDSAIGVVDLRNRRLTVYDLGGSLREGFPLPPVFRPLSSLTASGLLGLSMAFDRTDSLAARLVRVRRGTGEVVADVPLREAPGPGARIGFLRGVLLGDTSVLIHIEGYRFGRYSLTGEQLSAFEVPERVRQPAFPTERDLEDYRAAARQITGISPTAAEMEERRHRPLPPVVGPTRPRVGPGGTVWVASARDRVTRSWLDVFHHDAYVGSVSVRDRLLAFDLRGDTLVTLVERGHADEGDYPRALDWYRLERVPPP